VLTSRAAAREVPQVPVVEWSRFDALQARTSVQGAHKLFDGPTGCGKTVLARYLARHRDYVVVLGTKPRDASLDGYLDEGYVRVDQWPPKEELLTVTRNGKAHIKRRAYKLAPDQDGKVRLILWPEITKREDLHGTRQVFSKFFDAAYREGSWTIVVDETLWVTKRSGLGLDEQLSALAFMGRSSDLTLFLCMQRPRYMDRITWSSISDAYIFHTGVVDDVRDLASLGTNEPNQTVKVVQSLRGHQFLALPCRGQSEGWMISQVDVDS
jgi:hypothetical protein